MITSEYPPKIAGISHYVYNLSKNLIKKGHNVTVITRGSWRGLKRIFNEGVNIYELPYVPVYPFHIKIQNFLINKLFKFIENGFDIVHIHHPLPPLIHTKLPKIITVHTIKYAESLEVEKIGIRSSGYKLFSKYIFPFEKKIINSSDVLTSVSNSISNEIRVHINVKKQIHVLGNGVNTNYFSPIDRSIDNNDEVKKPYILYVGRLGYRKGLIDLIKSASYVCNSYPEAQFVIIGRGEIEKKLKILVKDMKLNNNFSFLGSVSMDELLYYYQNATIFVLPSYYEGLPTTILEAMACGLPVIATKVDGVPEIIRDGENGILIPKKNPKTMARAILTLLNDEEFRKKIGKNANITVKNNNSWDIICERALGYYKLALEMI